MRFYYHNNNNNKIINLMIIIQVIQKEILKARIQIFHQDLLQIHLFYQEYIFSQAQQEAPVPQECVKDIIIIVYYKM